MAKTQFYHFFFFFGRANCPSFGHQELFFQAEFF